MFAIKYEIIIGTTFDRDGKEMNCTAGLKTAAARKACDTFDGFTITETVGGYKANDGSYHKDEGFCVTVFGDGSEKEASKVHDFAGFLKTLYNQETVLVSETPCKAGLY